MDTHPENPNPVSTNNTSVIGSSDLDSGRDWKVDQRGKQEKDGLWRKVWLKGLERGIKRPSMY